MMQVAVGYSVSDSGTFHIPGSAQRRLTHETPAELVNPDAADTGVGMKAQRRRRARIARLVLSEQLARHPRMADMSPYDRLDLLAAVDRVCAMWLAAGHAA